MVDRSFGVLFCVAWSDVVRAMLINVSVLESRLLYLQKLQGICVCGQAVDVRNKDRLLRHEFFRP